MHYKIPDYIKKTGIAELPISYYWNDSDNVLFEVPKLYNKIDLLQGRSILALTIGFAEWINWRLSEVNKKQPELFLQFIEATWAAIIDRRYLNYVSLRYEYIYLEHYKMSSNVTSFKKLYKGDMEEDIDKQVEGPLLSSFMNLSFVADQTVPQHSDTTTAIYVSNAAEMVMGEKLDVFKKWRRDTIKRLDTFYHYSETDYLGVPVPREVLDPSFDYNPNMAPELINNFLSSLDYKSNPFLTPPDEMISLGFEGTPYMYKVSPDKTHNTASCCNKTTTPKKSLEHQLKQAFSALLGENIDKFEEGYQYDLYVDNSQDVRCRLNCVCKDDGESFLEVLEDSYPEISDEMWCYDYDSSLYNISNLCEAIESTEIKTKIHQSAIVADSLYIKGKRLAEIFQKYDFDVDSLVESIDPFPPSIIANVSTDHTLFDVMKKAHNIFCDDYNKLYRNYQQQNMRKLHIDMNWQDKIKAIEDVVLRYNISSNYIERFNYNMGVWPVGEDKLKELKYYEIFNAMPNHKVLTCWETPCDTTYFFIVQIKL